MSGESGPFSGYVERGLVVPEPVYDGYRGEPGDGYFCRILTAEEFKIMSDYEDCIVRHPELFDNKDEYDITV